MPINALSENWGHPKFISFYWKKVKPANLLHAIILGTNKKSRPRLWESGFLIKLNHNFAFWAQGWKLKAQSYPQVTPVESPKGGPQSGIQLGRPRLNTLRSISSIYLTGPRSCGTSYLILWIYRIQQAQITRIKLKAEGSPVKFASLHIFDIFNRAGPGWILQADYR